MYKILFISGSYPPDKCGIAFYLQNLLENLQDFVDIILALPDKNRQLEYNFCRFPKDLFKYIKEHNIKLVHWQLITQGFRYKLYFLKYFFLLKLKKNLKQITTIHDFSTLHFLNKMRLMVPILLSDHIIVTNEIDFNIIKKYNKNISIVPIGSNIIVSDKIKEKPIDMDGIRLLFWGFPVRNRELDKIFDAMYLLKNDGINFILTILPGFYNISEKEKTYYLNRISELDLGQYIKITGFLNEDDMLKVIFESDLALLFYTDGITFRRTTFLGIAGAGIPYLVNHGQNTPDILKQLVDISAVNPLTSENIVDKIYKFINDKKSFYREYKRINKYIFDNFGWQSIKEKHLNIYKKFLNI